MAELQPHPAECGADIKFALTLGMPILELARRSFTDRHEGSSRNTRSRIHRYPDEKS